MSDAAIEWMRNRRFRNGKTFRQKYPLTQVEHNPTAGPFHVFKVFLDPAEHQHIFVSDTAEVVEKYHGDSLVKQGSHIGTNFGMSYRLHFEKEKNFTIYYNFGVTRTIGRKGEFSQAGPVTQRLITAFQQRLLSWRLRKLQQNEPISACSSSSTDFRGNGKLAIKEAKPDQ